MKWIQLLLLVTFAASVGCGTQSSNLPKDLSLLYGRVFTDHQFAVVPGRRWDYSEVKQGWTFRTQASLWWYVHQTPESPVTVRVRPATESEGFWFQPYWDGEPLAEVPMVMEAEGITLEIPPERLTAGTHELRLRRRSGPLYGPDTIDNVFAAMSVSSAERDVPLVREELATYRQLASFLEFGATGHDQEKRSGFLFLEPRTVEMTVHRDEAAMLRVMAENLGNDPARFAVSNGSDQFEQTLDGPGRQRFRIPLSEGRNRLTFEVTAGGPFLWGAPMVTGPPDRRPSIILLSLDTTRRDALAPYGAPSQVTPALATFAERATVFEQALATSSWTLPSHGSMFTGLYPSRHRAGVSVDKLPSNIATLAQILRGEGYYTAGVSGGPLTAHRFGLGQGFHQYRDPDRSETRGDRMTDLAEEVLDEWDDRPVFLFLNYFDAHGPYQAPEESKAITGVDRLRQALDDPDAWGATIEGKAGQWQELTAGLNPIPDDVLAYLRSVYLSEVAFMDSQLGRLFDRLRRDGLFDRSMVVITADHGQLLGEYGFHGHGKRLDPELVDAPLIVKWPRQQEAGRVADLASIVDVFPTILATAGITPPPSDGFILGPTSIPERGELDVVVIEEHESLVHPLRGPMRIAPHLVGFQSRDFRHVWWRDGEHCANYLDRAWVDTTCPQDDPRRSQIEQRLDSPVAEVAAGAEPLSAADRQRLEALGYL